MNKKLAFLILIPLAVLLAGCNREEAPTEITAQPPRRTSSKLETVECPFQSSDQDERQPQCGYLAVPEDRQNPNGTMIKLFVVVYKSAAETVQPDALLVLSGGGGGSYGGAMRTLSMFGDAAANRDVVTYSMRGTGSSEPVLTCDGLSDLSGRALSERIGSQALLQDTLDLYRACRQKLDGEGVKLDAYTTTANVEDLMDLRLALGYAQWNIYASGYSTRIALELARLDPQGVRSLVMETVYPPQMIVAEEQASAAAVALDLLFSRCAADEQCNPAFPDLRAIFYHLVDELNALPLTVKVSNLNSGAQYDVVVDGYRLIDTVLNLLLSPGQNSVGQIPRMIYQLKDGKSQQLAEFLGSGFRRAPGSDLMTTRYNCADDWAFTSKEKIQRAQSGVEPAVAEYFNLSQGGNLAVCDVWQSAKPSAAAKTSVTSGVPVLVLAGDYNWYSPPAWAKRLSETMPNTTVVEFAGAGQLRFGGGPWDDCVFQIGSAFLNTPAAKPATACAAEPVETLWVTLP